MSQGPSGSWMAVPHTLNCTGLLVMLPGEIALQEEPPTGLWGTLCEARLHGVPGSALL